MHTPPALARRDFLARTGTGLGAALLAGLHGGAHAQAPAPVAVGLEAGMPSITARIAALHRAVHQLMDTPRVLDDPLALSILGPLAPGELERTGDRQHRSMRASIVMRSRYAEDRLAAAVARGVRQYVILGAGLDTFAYRNPHEGAGLRVFEVDHPATQRVKRQRLETARIAVPPSLTFVPIDFEKETLAQRLQASGFRADQPAFFSMLGVAIYISDSALQDTLRVVGAGARGSEIVLSFSVPEHALTPEQRAYRRRSMAQVAALGEPWISFHDPAELSGTLRDCGFRSAEVFGPAQANQDYFAGRTDGLRISNAYMMAAVV